MQQNEHELIQNNTEKQTKSNNNNIWKEQNPKHKNKTNLSFVPTINASILNQTCNFRSFAGFTRRIPARLTGSLTNNKKHKSQIKKNAKNREHKNKQKQSTHITNQSMQKRNSPSPSP